MKTTRTFKSGNSVAVRLPKALGVRPGTEVVVREQRGSYIVEPVKYNDPSKKIDLSGIYASIPGFSSLIRDDGDYEDIPREWHLLGLQPR